MHGSVPRLGSAFETLEDRTVPSTFGVPWADASHLTLSFAPNGAQTPLGANTLATALAAAGSSAAWKTEILRAFQTWAMYSNIDIGLVADGGQAVGALGAIQGDSRFGDIRVAAAQLSPELLSSTSPFSWIGSTLSGDMVLNSNSPFRIGGTTGYDLFSVALHEAGHALGLAHENEAGGPSGSNSVMDALYTRLTSLPAEDIAAIRALYGTRTQDAYDLAGGNNTRGTASSLPQMLNGQFLATGDLTTLSDVDYYKFTAPVTSAVSGITIRLKAAGLSLLTPKITILDSAGNVVQNGVDYSYDPLNNDLQVVMPADLLGQLLSGGLLGGLLGKTFYVKVEGAQENAFGIGGYKLAVDMLTVPGLLSPITTLTEPIADGGLNDLLATALNLQTNNSNDARFDATYRGVIESPSDVDYYKIRTNTIPSGTPTTFDVMVWGLGSNQVDPRIRIYDSNGNPVSYQLLSNSRGLFSIQVLNAVAGRDYYIQVAARNPGGANNTGSYFMAADFNRSTPLAYNKEGGGTVNPGATNSATLNVSKGGMFQFALGVYSGQNGARVTMTIRDANGNVVLTLTATAGEPTVTATQYLRAGTYTVSYTGASSNSQPISYGLFMLQLSDGVGPYATSTGSPSPPPPPSYDGHADAQETYTYQGPDYGSTTYWYWY